MAKPINIEVKAKTEEASQKLESMFKGGAQAAGVLIAAIAAVATKVYALVDDLSKAAEKLGVTVTEFSSLAAVFAKSGVEAEELGSHLRNLSQRAAQSDPIFRQLGIDVYKTNGAWKQADELLLEVADKFSNMPDGVEKVNLAMKLFGDSGNSMLKTLNLGSDALKQFREEAITTGVAIGEGLDEQLKLLQSRFAPTKDGFTTLSNEIAEDLLRLVNRGTEKLMEWTGAWDESNKKTDVTLKTWARAKIEFKELVRAIGAGGLINTETLHTPIASGLGKLKAAAGILPSGPEGGKPPERPALLTPEQNLDFRLNELKAIASRSQLDAGRSEADKLLSLIQTLEYRQKALAPAIQSLEAKRSEGKSLFGDGEEVLYYQRYVDLTKQLNPLLDDQAQTQKAISDAKARLKAIALDSAEAERKAIDEAIESMEKEEDRLQRIADLYEEIRIAENERENDAVQAQVDSENSTFGGKAAKRFGQYVKQWTDGSSVIDAAIGAIDTALSGLADGITGLLTGTARWADVWRQTVTSIIAGIAQMMVKFVALLGIVSLLQFLFPGSGFVAKFAGFAGFEDGGYTGDGGKLEPAGIVHKGEYVLPKEDVQRIGIRKILEFRRGIPTSLPRMNYDELRAASSQASRRESPRTIQINALFERSQIYEAMKKHPEFEHHVVDIVGNRGFTQI